MTDWVILRCAGSRTLALAASLNEAGFEAYSPLGIEEKRVGPLRTRTEVAVASMPCYVLARVDRLHDLLALSHAPALTYQIWDAEQRKMITKGHPWFTVFRGGNHRYIPDADVSALRRSERRPRTKQEPKVFAIGDQVSTDDGGFSGLVGTVVEVAGKMISVQFSGWDIIPKFASWLLTPAIDETRPVHVSSDGTEQALSAKAA